MKPFSRLFEPQIIRPTLYKAVTKFVYGLVLALLWDRFLNRERLYTMAEAAFLVVGVFLLAMAWLQYLRLDGMRVHYLGEKPAKPKAKKHRTKDIVDFVEEKIVPYEDLEPREQTICRLVSNLIAGGVFLAIAAADSFLF